VPELWNNQQGGPQLDVSSNDDMTMTVRKINHAVLLQNVKIIVSVGSTVIKSIKHKEVKI